jgi:hypothetical protein
VITRIKEYFHIHNDKNTEYEVPPFFVHIGWASFWQGKHLRSMPEPDTLD